MENCEINDNEIPPEYICPITLDIMKEPMVMPDGQTYEKEAIKQALETTHVSPLTKMPMNFSDGVINYALKSLIENYLKERKERSKPSDGTEQKNEEPESVKVEFEELNARFISSDTSANLCKDSVYISMKPKKVKTAPPLFLVCVVDVSGSMCENCCNNIENMESMYVSRLSLVKHSLKTIISTLRNVDKICIIKFENSASIVVPPTTLSSKNVKNLVIKKLDEMREGGGTNMWDGMKTAIDTIKTFKLKNYQESIMVFTDGDSNVNPPNGVYLTLNDTLKASKDNFTISTFSFGSNVQSKLLVDIAKLGNGIYGYCPDGTMVGTIFINYMANLLSTITPVVKVILTQGKDIKKTMTIGPLYRGNQRSALFLVEKNLLNQTKIKIELPYLNQEFEVPLNEESFNLQDYINRMAQLESDQSKDSNANNDEDEEDELLDEEDDDDTVVMNIDNIDTNIEIEENDKVNVNPEEAIYNQVLRNKFITTLSKILKIGVDDFNPVENASAKDILNNYFDLLKQLRYKSKFAKSLIIDIKNDNPNHGQVDKAIEKQYFYSWGECYLSSFLRFHQFEQCGNFKDQSLQYYASEVFTYYRNMANTIFINLPPPTSETVESFLFSIISGSPTANRSGATRSFNNNNNNSIQMRSFLNRHGGCFNGEAIALLRNGKAKCVKDLKKGDCLYNGAIVKCLIEQKSASSGLSKPYMCNINGVFLTPYHPISIGEQWYFPADLVQAEPVDVETWFNLVLEDPIHKKYEVEFKNGIKAITLGHYRTENSVLKHPYFGTDLVLKDLEERDPQGYSNGYIYIEDFDPRQLQYDENQCCINYYKIQSNTNDNTITNINAVNSIDMVKEKDDIKLSC